MADPGRRQLLRWVCQPITFTEDGMRMKEFGSTGACPWHKICHLDPPLVMM